MRTKTSRLIILLLILVSLVGYTNRAAAQTPSTFSLTIFHTNDTHSHHEPGADGNGGITREATLLKRLRVQVANSLLVDAGDRFTGTLYHKYYLGQDNVRIMNALGYQVMTLGNHEFDNGLDILARFLDGLKFPVVAANIDASQSPALKDKWKPYAVLEVGGEKIGFIGLTTAETPDITINYPGKENVVFSDQYAEIVNATVKKLNAQGVNKIILLTHLGVGVDTELAKQISGVGLIVGGHSHTLLTSPIKETNADGDPIYIVQAGSYTQYLGMISLEYDGKGHVVSANGAPIQISNDTPEDPDVKALLAELAAPIAKVASTPVKTPNGDDAQVAVTLNQRECFNRECLLGDVIADAMRMASKAQIAMMNTGGIRASIEKGTVTVGEVITVLPFGNTLATMKLTGADVIAALENGVSKIDASSGGGRFPQVSGLRFSFDASKPAGQRILGVDVLGADGTYKPIDPKAIYTVVTNDFMRGGGDGYNVFKDKAIDPYDFGPPLDQVVIDYIGSNSPINPSLDGRIEQK